MNKTKGHFIGLVPLIVFLVLCYEMTIVKWKYHVSLIFVFRLFLCNFNQGHRTRNFYTDLSAVGHSVMRGLVTSGQWFRRKFLCL